jgi:hypothetical protein
MFLKGKKSGRVKNLTLLKESLTIQGFKKSRLAKKHLIIINNEKTYIYYKKNEKEEILDDLTGGSFV